MVLIIVGAIVLVVLVVALIVRIVRRRRPDPVDSFRRQIDALSPEARRPTVDQVRDAADDPGATGDDDS